MILGHARSQGEGMSALVAATPAGVTHALGPFPHLSARYVLDRGVWRASASGLARLADGNVAPVRTISGASTGLSLPAGIAVVP
jgi:hypothetical protein